MSQKNEHSRRRIRDTIIIALIGMIGAAIGATISGYFNYKSDVTPKEIYIRATQTAEARQPILQTVEVTRQVTQQVFVTQLVTPTFTPTSTPMPNLLDAMDIPANWQADACNDICGRANRTVASVVLANSVPGYANNAVEVLYNIPHAGWILIKKNINPEILTNTKGIRFFYKGAGAPNTIELKMVLRYAGDTKDTTFGKSWNSATDTGNNWKLFQAFYGKDIKCWWPTDLCEQHGNTLDLTAVYKIELGISNQSGDLPGLGRGTFDELMGIPLDSSN